LEIANGVDDPFLAHGNDRFNRPLKIVPYTTVGVAWVALSLVQ
jgi:hypothetical protein